MQPIFKIPKSKGGSNYSWVKGKILKEYDHYILVDLKHYKECFLKVDKGQTWKVVRL